MNATAKPCTACFESIDPRASRCAHCGQRQGDVVGLYRNLPGKAVGGVTAALAHHFNWDVTLMRVLFLVSFAFSAGMAFWVYLTVWLMTPYERDGRAPALQTIDWLQNLFTPRRSSGVDEVR